jgi:hypothetical protein
LPGHRADPHSVATQEGEPSLGSVTSLVISVGTQSADRRVRVDQIRAVEPGLVRLDARKVELEPA